MGKQCFRFVNRNFLLSSFFHLMTFFFHSFFEKCIFFVRPTGNRKQISNFFFLPSEGWRDCWVKNSLCLCRIKFFYFDGFIGKTLWVRNECSRFDLIFLFPSFHVFLKNLWIFFRSTCFGKFFDNWSTSILSPSWLRIQ